MAKSKEKGYKRQPNDEVVDAGDHMSGDDEAIGEVILTEPSGLALPYMGVEDQGMPMRTEIVGPPSYGSPNPSTSAGKLLPLDDHPLNADKLEKGHPAAIAKDYGADHTEDYVMPGESSHPVIPLADSAAAAHADAERAGMEAEVDATDAARELAEENGVSLADVEGSGEGGRVTKGDVEAYLAENEDDSE